MEFVNGDGQHEGITNTGFTTAGVGVDFLGEGLEDHGVLAGGNTSGHVHQNVKGLVGPGRKFLQVLSWNLNVPDDVNTKGVSDPSQAEVKAVRSVTVVGHGDGQRDLVAGVHVHRRAHGGVNAGIEVKHVFHVGGKDGGIRDSGIAVQIPLERNGGAETGRGVLWSTNVDRDALRDLLCVGRDGPSDGVAETVAGVR